jgi:hypothetical protein
MTTHQIGRLLPQRVLSAAALAIAILVPSSQWANATDDNPFGDAVKVADASLDTVRGGFDAGRNVFVPFGIDVNFASFVNGMKVAGVHVTNHGISSNAIQGTVNGVNVTVDVPPTGPGPVGPNGIVPTTAGNGITNVTTSFGSNGIMTLIQNNRPNITLQTQQVLNVQITGMQNLIRSSVAAGRFNGRGFFH